MLIESVGTDLSAAYISAVRQNIPDAVYVFDHFHIVKLVNEALDKVRKRIVREERAKEILENKELQSLGLGAPTTCKSSVVKGTRYILIRNRSDITKESDIERHNAALELNSDLSTAYYLKEESKLIWMCDSKPQAETQLLDWLSKLKSSGIREMVKLANSISLFSDGILSYYDKPISTASVEVINNKTKTLKRMAYGFRDKDYFNIRLLALHDYKAAGLTYANL